VGRRKRHPKKIVESRNSPIVAQCDVVVHEWPQFFAMVLDLAKMFCLLGLAVVATTSVQLVVLPEIVRGHWRAVPKLIVFCYYGIAASVTWFSFRPWDEILSYTRDRDAEEVDFKYVAPLRNQTLLFVSLGSLLTGLPALYIKGILGKLTTFIADWSVDHPTFFLAAAWSVAAAAAGVLGNTATAALRLPAEALNERSKHSSEEDPSLDGPALKNKQNSSEDLTRAALASFGRTVAMLGMAVVIVILQAASTIPAMLSGELIERLPRVAISAYFLIMLCVWWSCMKLFNRAKIVESKSRQRQADRDYLASLERKQYRRVVFVLAMQVAAVLYTAGEIDAAAAWLSLHFPHVELSGPCAWILAATCAGITGNLATFAAARVFGPLVAHRTKKRRNTRGLSRVRT
jgi:hypothetical protein